MSTLRTSRIGSAQKDGDLPIGPHSSMGSPITFMMRPKVERPTGIYVLELISSVKGA